MTLETDPYDVMEYHDIVSQILKQHIDTENKNKYLIRQLEEASHSINRFFREGTLDYTRSLVNIIILGAALDSIDEIPVVDPNGNILDSPASEIYGKRLLNEENPWEHVYELEVAQDCHSAGLDTKLVDEGQQTGPDVFVDCNGSRIYIECKRRRRYNPETDSGGTYEIIRDQIDDLVSIDEDSYFIELTSDGPLDEGAIDKLATQAADVIENQWSEKTTRIAGTEYKIVLRDYFHGEKESDMSKNDIEFWTKYNAISSHALQKFLSPFDSDQMSPGAKINMMIMFTSEGKAVCKNCSVIDFNFPTIDSKLYDRIINTTLRKGRQDLSGCSPGVLFIHLPAYETEDMQRYHVQEGDYDPTPQVQRLNQRITGELKDSSSLNAVVINITFFEAKGNDCQVMRGYKIFKNPSPKVSLPKEFDDYISGEYFEKI